MAFPRRPDILTGPAGTGRRVTAVSYKDHFPIKHLKPWVARCRDVSFPGVSPLGAVWHAHVRRPRQRRRLRAWLRATEAPGPLGITVLVVVRNRADQRFDNLMKSLAAQDLDRARFEVLVLDFGSDPAPAGHLRRACAHYDFRYEREEDTAEWHQGRAQNAALRRVRTSAVLICDVDLMLAPNYLSTAVGLLEQDLLGAVVAPMLDLPELPGLDYDAQPFAQLLDRTGKRFGWDFHPAIIALRVRILKLIGGVDEEYQLWGGIDVDLYHRLRALGLNRHNVAGTTAYVHQWHPKFQGVNQARVEAARLANAERLMAKRSPYLDRPFLQP